LRAAGVAQKEQRRYSDEKTNAHGLGN
jgi:hypothetical protein